MKSKLSNIDWNRVEFKGEKRFLSNMYPCNIIFDGDENFKKKYSMFNFDGELYRSSEHLYQSLKCKDPNWAKYIRSLDDPHLTKWAAKNKLSKYPSLFKEIKSYVIREDWHDIKIVAMEMVLYLKFSQNSKLKEKLLNLSGYIEERNCWNDKFWGTVDGKGDNHLGKLLMKLRDELRN